MDRDWLDVGGVEEIPLRGTRVIATKSGPVAVFRTTDNRIFATRDRCPHKNGPLSQGIVHGTRVTCPLHGWTIDLATGEAIAPDRGCVPTIPTQVVDGRILLHVTQSGR
ncbi:MAG: nitrite reductase small subunit NirD [Rhodospirillaceae bacterium]|nr:MAG: nitrite reductase small subunit NirD [Rhodospirillaceae bacterium]